MKGVGDITIAAFLAEVGDLNNYDHPEQMIKLAGLNLKLATSGKWQGRTVITKRAAQSYAPCCTKLSCHWSIKKRKSVKEKAIVDSTML